MSGNGWTTYGLKAAYYESEGSCEIQPLPDYSSYPDKFEAQIWNSSTMQYDTITGTVVGQDSCELTCPSFCPAWIPDYLVNPTGIKPEDLPLQFSANPTLVDNFVRFSSNKPITRVVAYDITGKIALSATNLHNNEVDASGLPKGPYFIRVYFSSNETRTVKVLKQ
jgi:hypothetical protein